MTAGGVPAGATMLYHDVTSNPGRPDSSIVGSAGAVAMRFGLATASARSLPPVDLWQRRGRRSEHHLHVARHDGRDRRRDAVVGHMHDVDARAGLEELAGQVRAAAARRATRS